jgi:hypothetical protein
MGNRTRFRTVPHPLNGANTPVGKFYVEFTPNSNDWRHIADVNGITVPYFKAGRVTDEVHPGPPWKSGGPFEKIEIGYPDLSVQGKGIYITSSIYSFFGVGTGRVKYVGGFAPHTNWPGFNLDHADLTLVLGPNSPLLPNTTTLDNQVYQRTKPQLEQGGLFVALREGKDLPRMLQTTARGFADSWRVFKWKGTGSSLLAKKMMTPKYVGDHWINQNFGWVPFISDLTKYIDNIVDYDRKISRLIRDNDKWIRRKVILVNHTEDVDIDWGEASLVRPAADHLMEGCYVPTWKPYWNAREVKTTIAHGIGRFRYYQPYLSEFPESGTIEGMLGPIRRQLLVHGARISPMNLYRSTKWTWLADWVSNTGSVLQAIQDAALDGMAAKYLFLTHHQIKHQLIRQFLPFDANNGGTKELTFTRIIDVKQRKEASSPFEFHLTWDQLTPKQLSILAALGITRR